MQCFILRELIFADRGQSAKLRTRKMFMLHGMPSLFPAYPLQLILWALVLDAPHLFIQSLSSTSLQTSSLIYSFLFYLFSPRTSFPEFVSPYFRRQYRSQLPLSSQNLYAFPSRLDVQYLTPLDLGFSTATHFILSSARTK